MLSLTLSDTIKDNIKRIYIIYPYSLLLYL
nr:MAG TPA: hypothetical protein [Caudoviricetes sp.]